MTPKKLKVGFFLFAYGGNGGCASILPHIAEWLTRTVLQASKDERIEEVHSVTLSDTPITMQRNAAVLKAREMGLDVIVMVDSDQVPDCEPDGQPFFPTSFDFLYRHWDDFPAIIAAPYCGPPPAQNVYVFRFASDEPDSAEHDTDHRLDAFTREEAATLSGIQPIDAAPTGLMMCAMPAFELTDPMPAYRELLAQGMPPREASARVRPWFYYEFESVYESQKHSTEDVTATRDIVMAGHAKLGKHVLYCNWSAWAGHMKPKMVRKPRVITADMVGEKYTKAAIGGRKSNETLRFIGKPSDNSGIPIAPLPEFARNGHSPRSELQRAFQDPNGPLLDRPVKRIGDMYTPACDLLALTEIVRHESLKLDRPLKVIEVGSWVGESALAMWEGMKNGGGEIICVDLWQGSPGDVTHELAKGENVRRVFEHNVGHLLGKGISYVEGLSVFRAKAMPEQSADIIFIDADHSRKAVAADIEAWLPHLRPGGLMLFHDYHVQNFPGVTLAVDEFVESVAQQNLGICEWGQKHAIAWVRVPKVKHGRNGQASSSEVHEAGDEVHRANAGEQAT